MVYTQSVKYAIKSFVKTTIRVITFSIAIFSVLAFGMLLGNQETMSGNENTVNFALSQNEGNLDNLDNTIKALSALLSDILAFTSLNCLNSSYTKELGYSLIRLSIYG